MFFITYIPDTIQTALQNASVLVKSLLNIGRPGSSPVFNTASSSASTSSAHDQQTDRTRIDYMNRLTNAIQRNIRVRYELDASEVVRS
jgi:rapamycin-insensitive companion of mTOR